MSQQLGLAEPSMENIFKQQPFFHSARPGAQMLISSFNDRQEIDQLFNNTVSKELSGGSWGWAF